MVRSMSFCLRYARLAVLTALVAGLMQMLAAFLRLGFLVSFLAHPVISGFTSGAAIIIGLSQVKYLLGFSIPKSEFAHATISNIFQHIEKTKPPTLLLGLASILFLLGCKHLAARKKRLGRLKALGPLLCCMITTLLIGTVKPFHSDTSARHDQVDHVEDIPSGLFPITIPGLGNKFSSEDWKPYSWSDDMSRVLPTAISATAIGYMESIAISRSLAAKNGYQICPTQEMFALGLSNVVGSMFSCYPVAGSFSRWDDCSVKGHCGAIQIHGVLHHSILFILSSLI